MKNKKMIEKTKKVGTSILAGLLLVNSISTTSLSAFDWGSAADYGDYGVGNVGKKLYESGDSIGYQVFGNYSFRLNQKRSIPLWNIQPPEASIGCNGLSFKGGFMSLINIDQLGDQLRDAGAALAWGILLGLVTSLPSIKEVFDTINKWARMIQDLLANACNVGKKIGTSIRKQDMNSLFSSASDKSVTAASGSKEYLNDAQDSGSDFMDSITKGLANADAWASSPLTPDEKSDMQSTMINALIPNSSSMLMTKAVTSAINLYNIKAKDLFSNGLIIEDANYMVGDLGYPKPIDNLRDYNFKLLTAFIITAYAKSGGSQGLTQKGEGVINLFAKTTKDIKDGSISQEEGSKKLNEIISNNDNIEFLTDYHLGRQGGGKLSEIVINWAKCGMNTTMDGCENSHASDLKEIELPSFYMVKQDFVSTKPKSIKVIEKGYAQATPKFIKDTTWSNYINSTGNFEQIAENQLACVTRKTVPTGITCSMLPPITGKDLKDWVYIYSQSSESDKRDIEDMLKKKLEDDLKRTFIDYLDIECGLMTSNSTDSVSIGTPSSINKAKKGNGKTTNSKNTEKINSIKECKNFVNEIRNALDVKKVSFEDGPKSFDAAMKDINNRNLDRLRRNIRK